MVCWLRSADSEAGVGGMIRTKYEPPSIPIRTWDWRAWYEELGEDSPTGWGETEAEAVQDLKDKSDL